MRIDRFLIVAIIVAIVSAAKSIPRINRRRLFPLYNHEEVQAAMKKIGKDLRVCVCDMSIVNSPCYGSTCHRIFEDL